MYYAKQRIPGESLLSRLLDKLSARRAYYARKRGPIYRDVPVEGKDHLSGPKASGKIAQDREVEPPTIVEKEKEVVKWIDRIVLIPRWGIKTPIHVNSLIRNKKSYDEPNVTEIRKMRDGRQD